MNDRQEVGRDEAEELGEAFFENAVLTRPGESVVEVVSRAKFETPTDLRADNTK
jgi:hypothetical protein